MSELLIQEIDGYYIYDGESMNLPASFKDEEGNECPAEFYVHKGCTLLMPSPEWKEKAQGKISIILQ